MTSFRIFSWCRRWLGALLLSGTVCSLWAAEEKPRIADLFGSPAITALTFSPNGKYIACLVPHERRLNLAVIDLEKGTKNLLTNFKDKQASRPFWASDNRVLFRVDDDGKESFALYAVNRDGTEPGILASGYSKIGTNEELNPRFRSVLGTVEGDPNNLLVLANLTHADWSDVAQLNLKTGAMKKLIEAPGNVDYYVRDHRGQVRLAVINDREQMRRVLVRDPEKRQWSVLTEHHRDGPGWEPVAFDGDDRTLFISSDVGRKTKAIYRYDLTKRRQLDLVCGDDTYDVAEANSRTAPAFVPLTIYDPSRRKVVGLAYTTDRTQFHWLDDELRELHRKISASLPDTVHRVRQISADGSKIIFLSSSDRDPGVYYLYDRKRQKLNELAVIRPKISPEAMAPTRAIQFAARDGLPLHGYLTLPRGEASKKLPAVLIPHGGPFGLRDEWGFNNEVQFFASRGFAVLQVNFRGSGGYGREFEAAGFKQWGLAMQDDLTDGVKWLIAQGIADPERFVICGASYGGYATLAGLVRTPELYCAGINYVGVSNIELLIPEQGPAERQYWYSTRLGDLANPADRRRIYETSPVNFVSQIQAPLLMAYGKNDPRVHINHGYDLERALKKAGKSFELVIAADEGHGFRNEENAVAFYSKVEEFLEKNVRSGHVKIGPTRVVQPGAGSVP